MQDELRGRDVLWLNGESAIDTIAIDKVHGDARRAQVDVHKERQGRIELVDQLATGLAIRHQTL